jgi:hypothetical protein
VRGMKAGRTRRSIRGRTGAPPGSFGDRLLVPGDVYHLYIYIPYVLIQTVILFCFLCFHRSGFISTRYCHAVYHMLETGEVRRLDSLVVLVGCCCVTCF